MIEKFAVRRADGCQPFIQQWMLVDSHQRSFRIILDTAESLGMLATYSTNGPLHIDGTKAAHTKCSGWPFAPAATRSLLST